MRQGTGEALDITQVGTTWVAGTSYFDGFVELKGKYNEDDFLPATFTTTGIAGRTEKTTIPLIDDTRVLSSISVWGFPKRFYRYMGYSYRC